MQVQGRRVRLVGVDAPELQQTCTDNYGCSYDCGARPCFMTLRAFLALHASRATRKACVAGEVAAAALRALVGRASISCKVLQTDRYKRAVARCTRPATLFQRQVDIGEWLLERGHAVVYRYCCAIVTQPGCSGVPAPSTLRTPTQRVLLPGVGEPLFMQHTLLHALLHA